MNVLGLKPGHDGAVAFLADGELEFSLGAEVDSFERHSPLTAESIALASELAQSEPDIVAIGGWHKILPSRLSATGGGYWGLDPGRLESATSFGRHIHTYSSSHERSHIFGAVAMSPFDSEQRLTVLVWEGIIGCFYRWNGARRSIERIAVLDQPGARYSALFALALEAFPNNGGFPESSFAGKLMALCGLADQQEPSPDTRQVVNAILGSRAMYPFSKTRYRRSPLFNCGFAEPELWRAARYMTDRMFEIFRSAATSIEPGAPLVISGGCGLNCEWNTRWRDSGLFSQVFVPPCTDDSGSAIGTAVDAMVQGGGDCDLAWNVYSGPPFISDVMPESLGWHAQLVDYDELAAILSAGEVVAWVQGRCEIGPRALGHRSLLASVSSSQNRHRLNSIKKREDYRPIAPVCLEADLGRWFDDAAPDPHMLYFRRVLDPSALPAVTHADGTARVQSVTPISNQPLYDLLTANRKRFGLGVLCNTSLNLPGMGFINRTSELFDFCETAKITNVVIDDRWYKSDVEVH